MVLLVFLVISNAFCIEASWLSSWLADSGWLAASLAGWLASCPKRKAIWLAGSGATEIALGQALLSPVILLILPPYGFSCQ